MAPAGAASWKAGRLTKESELSKTVYNLFFKRNSSYVATIFSIAIVGGIAFDSVLTSMWNTHNKGVRARALPCSAGGGGRAAPRGGSDEGSEQIPIEPRAAARSRAGRRPAAREVLRGRWCAIFGGAPKPAFARARLLTRARPRGGRYSFLSPRAPPRVRSGFGRTSRTTSLRTSRR
jgi:ubiquinol-cytochrome c reductase subunit 9